MVGILEEEHEKGMSMGSARNHRYEQNERWDGQTAPDGNRSAKKCFVCTIKDETIEHCCTVQHKEHIKAFIKLQIYWG